MSVIDIDIFSDPACPWCLIGLTRLDLALGQLGLSDNANIRHHPYLLDTNVRSAGENMRDLLRAKYGRDPGPMWDRLEAEAGKSGIALDMRKQTMRYPSQAAITLILAASDKGTQHQLAKALCEAYYLKSANISDPETLAAIALQFGFTRAEVMGLVTHKEVLDAVTEAANCASQKGVTSVPFFIFQRHFAFSGAQPMDVFVQTLRSLTDKPKAGAA